MEKRLLNYMLASVLVIMAYVYVQQLWVGPPAGKVAQKAPADLGKEPAGQPGKAENQEATEPGEPGAPEEPAGAEGPGAAGERAESDQGAAKPQPAAEEVAEDEAAEGGAEEAAGEPEEEAIASTPSDLPQQWTTLGSLDPKSPYRMLVTFTNRGAAIERVELNVPRYRDLEDFQAYIGHLEVTPVAEGGVRVQVVGPGTPAARARIQGQEKAVGLRVGDVITRVGKETVDSQAEFLAAVRAYEPGEPIGLTVDRPAEGGTRRMQLVVVGQRRPQAVIRPEPAEAQPGDRHPLSYLLRLDSIGKHGTELHETELAGIPSLATAHWQMQRVGQGDQEGVEFRYRLGSRAMDHLGLSGGWEIVKRYRLVRVPQEDRDNPGYPGYHLTLEVELVNLGTAAQTISYRLDGPTGLPLEGWWYAYKSHPTSWSRAGLRDVVFRLQGGRHLMFTNRDIVKHADEERTYSLIEPEGQHGLRYAGVDAQYFLSALVEWNGKNGQPLPLAGAVAMTVAPTDPLSSNRTDVSFRLVTPKRLVGPGESLSDELTIFVGPKRPELLAQYGLQDSIVYGWFGPVAKLLTRVLHGFYAIVHNYGIAIVLLTVMVRGLMFPLGRQQARSAAKMQELAPEMKRIAEQYKNDMEKRAAAQRELFRKHSYNPLSGCLLMFVQLPIFVGLYRALSVDIELRQAPLIPGLRWCSNLAGPDKLLYWGDWGFMPEVLVGPTGYLGPYLNLLPLISIVLFLVQQKLFTPPPTDDQQVIQQKMMKFMTVFIGILFFKVPAGLCLYFIASGLWSIGERKTLGSTALRPAEEAGTRAEPSGGMARVRSSVEESMRQMLGKKPPGGNGASRAARRKRVRRRP